ncbi:MAG: hypothetical protein ACERK6_06800, partial [Candidatus Aminicenantaceae bacterium]
MTEKLTLAHPDQGALLIRLSGTWTLADGIPSPEELLAALPTGTDVLSKAINVAWEIEDNVLARTKYLSENSSADEMPRYIRLKKDIIGEY